MSQNGRGSIQVSTCLSELGFLIHYSEMLIAQELLNGVLRMFLTRGASGSRESPDPSLFVWHGLYWNWSRFV